MEALEQLELQIDQLLERMRMLSEENSRLQAEISELMRDRDALTQENQSLQQLVQDGASRRQQAFDRIQALLHKIEESGFTGRNS